MPYTQRISLYFRNIKFYFLKCPHVGGSDQLFFWEARPLAEVLKKLFGKLARWRNRSFIFLTSPHAGGSDQLFF
jgi:hypothetical protein